LSVVGGLELGRRDIAAVLVEPFEVEPVDPFRGRELDLFDGPPGALLLDQLGLVQVVDRLREGVIVRIANAANRSSNPDLGKALTELDRRVLTPADALLFVKWPWPLG